MIRFWGVISCGMVRSMHVTPWLAKLPTRIRSHASPIRVMPAFTLLVLVLLLLVLVLLQVLVLVQSPLHLIACALLTFSLSISLLPFHNPLPLLLPLSLLSSCHPLSEATSGGREWQHGITAKSILRATAHRSTASVRHLQWLGLGLGVGLGLGLGLG
jgi:hypothetical protein